MSAKAADGRAMALIPHQPRSVAVEKEAGTEAADFMRSMSFWTGCAAGARSLGTNIRQNQNQQLPPPSRVRRSRPKPSDFVGQDFVRLGTAIDKPEVAILAFDEHAIDRVNQRNVSSAIMESTIAQPLIVLQQTPNKYLFLSDSAGVVITKNVL
ncbi:hypothetical protein [Methylocapsa palsarum]|uniref:hypothetical protein n=1 Tax=Methylocapsa palsarum TaxID=1612308 RepID=UPI0011134DB0|nr:hypothetical protein [Methylocapsa palsarum]